MIAKRGLWIFGGLVLFLVLFLPGYSKIQEFKEKNRELKWNIERLMLENIELSERLERIKSDPEYQEKIAREKLGVVKKGEIPVKIIPEEQFAE